MTVNDANRAKVLAALYNAAMPLGLGHSHYIPGI